MASGSGEDPLAYGEDHGAAPQEGQDGERGIIGDTYRKLRSQYDQYDGSSGSKPATKPSAGGGLGSMLFHKIHNAVNEIGSRLDPNAGGADVKHSHTHAGAQCTDGMHDAAQHRYGSFAAQRNGNDAKWYVDGCGYMWAVSEALKRATESVWILDCEYARLLVDHHHN